MRVINTSVELVSFVDEQRKNGSTIGFVPTMGALHNGHGSLINRSSKENDLTIVSVFVDPTQFNDPADLQKYPRTISSDSEIAENQGCDILFVPEVSEIYPEGKPVLLNLNFGPIEHVMEGAFRKDHFNGMSTVVKRLFDIVRPDRAYFGEKDFQQLAIVKKMVELLKTPIEIIPCETVREDDGLAMSSRNARLNTEERKTALLLSKALFTTKQLKGKVSPEEAKQEALKILSSDNRLLIDYFEIADSVTLQAVELWENPVQIRAFVAAKVGEVRLIDNIGL